MANSAESVGPVTEEEMKAAAQVFADYFTKRHSWRPFVIAQIEADKQEAIDNIATLTRELNSRLGR